MKSSILLISFLILAVLQLQLHKENHYHVIHEKHPAGINSKDSVQAICPICVIHSHTKVQPVLKSGIELSVVASHDYKLNVVKLASKRTYFFYKEFRPRAPPKIS